MKKFINIVVCFVLIIFLVGCESKEKIVKAKLNKEGNIVIEKKDIKEKATFISYEVDGVTIGFIVVRGTDGKVRVAFNTCQSCSPSPNAYFLQEGEYFQCQNCGNKFHVDEIGVSKGGCNPAPVEEMTEDDDTIIISSEYAKTYKEKFENWNGPKA